jgi:hypothetical protein
VTTWKSQWTGGTSGYGHNTVSGKTVHAGNQEKSTQKSTTR